MEQIGYFHRLLAKFNDLSLFFYFFLEIFLHSITMA